MRQVVLGCDANECRLFCPIDVVDDVGGDGVVRGLVLAQVQQVLGVEVVEVFNLGHAFQVIPEAGTSEVEVQPKLGPRETGEVRMHWRILVRHLREDG